jgi:hypothetical protein
MDVMAMVEEGTRREVIMAMVEGNNHDEGGRLEPSYGVCAEKE